MIVDVPKTAADYVLVPTKGRQAIAQPRRKIVPIGIQHLRPFRLDLYRRKQPFPMCT